jgi:hypothetical protein
MRKKCKMRVLASIFKIKKLFPIPKSLTQTGFNNVKTRGRILHYPLFPEIFVLAL